MNLGIHGSWDPKNHGIHKPWDPINHGSHRSRNPTVKTPNYVLVIPMQHSQHSQGHLDELALDLSPEHRVPHPGTPRAILTPFRRFHRNIPGVPGVTLMSLVCISPSEASSWCVSRYRSQRARARSLGPSTVMARGTRGCSSVSVGTWDGGR